MQRRITLRYPPYAPDFPVIILAPPRMPAAAPTAGRAQLAAAGLFPPRLARPRIAAASPCPPGSCPSRVRQRKPRGGFGQAGGEPLLYQRHETARAIDIGIVAHGRTNRLGRRTRNRVTLGRARQRAAGQHADADDADARGLGRIEQSSIILCRVVRRQLLRGRWIEHVVDDLRAVEDTSLDHLTQRRRVADGRHPEKANLPLLTQPLERRHHVVEHLPDAKRRSAALSVIGLCK